MWCQKTERGVGEAAESIQASVNDGDGFNSVSD